jgi:hypothetical protein
MLIKQHVDAVTDWLLLAGRPVSCRGGSVADLR